MRLLLLALITVTWLSAAAENFTINIRSPKDLNALAAFEIELAFEPNAFVIDKDFSVSVPDILFKTVDPTKSILRVFLDATKAEPIKEIQLNGKLSRLNYNDEIKSSIKSIKYISDFSKQIDTKNIKAEILVSSADETLPYTGISNAKILGPSQRMAFNPMVIAISDIETYGFTLDKSVELVQINGVKARFVTDKIISAVVPFAAGTTELPVEILVKVHGAELRKNLGTIKLIETFN